MNKKEYMFPAMEVLKIEASSYQLLAGSVTMDIDNSPVDPSEADAPFINFGF